MGDRLETQVGNYRLTQIVGKGGFAEVYLGVHLHLGSQAAVKLLLTPLATAGEIEQFRLEAQTIVQLIHPHIVRLLDFGVEEGTPYLVMDYAPNGSLRHQFPGGIPVALASILPYLLQVAAALEYAHAQKLIHRDIKPENMLLGRNHEVLLSDFGVATVAQSSSLQKTQGVAGTAAYMAPEQLQGKPRPASDLYSLGIVVYEWLTGERPFQGGPLEVATQQVLTSPPPLREKVPTIPPEVEQVVLTALAKDPKERFGNVRAFVNALVQASQGVGTLSAAQTLFILPPAPAGEPIPNQGNQAGASLLSATTHITPHLTPKLSAPSLPGTQTSQPGASLLNATTHLTPPTTAPAGEEAGMNAPSSLPTLPVVSADESGKDSQKQPEPLAAGSLFSSLRPGSSLSSDVPIVPAAPLALKHHQRRRSRIVAFMLVAVLLIGTLAVLGVRNPSTFALWGFGGANPTVGPTATTSTLVQVTATHEPEATGTAASTPVSTTGPQPTDTPTLQPTGPQPTATPTPQPAVPPQVAITSPQNGVFLSDGIVYQFTGTASSASGQAIPSGNFLWYADNLTYGGTTFLGSGPSFSYLWNLRGGYYTIRLQVTDPVTSLTSVASIQVGGEVG